MARTAGSDDKDQLYLDTVISLGSDIRELIEKIKDISDDPEVLDIALQIEGKALIIQKLSRDYRPRLVQLRRTTKEAIKDQIDKSLENITKLLEELRESKRAPGEAPSYKKYRD